MAGRPDLRFAARFATLALASWLLHATMEPQLEPVARGTRAVVARVGDALGLAPAPGPGLVLTFAGEFSYIVTVGCSAVFVALLYASALLAYPARWTQRAVGLAVGLPALFAVNVARLVSMGWLGLHAPVYVEDAHLVWWQAFLVLVVAVGWLAWVKLAVEARPARRAREVASFAATFLAALTLLFGVGASMGARAGLDALLARGGERVAAEGLTGGYVLAVLAATAALFAATPRVPTRRRLVGAATVGVPVAAAALALQVAAAARSLRPGEAMVSLSFAGGMLLPIAAWLGWSWRRGAYAREAADDSCPVCARPQRDLLAHLRVAHPEEHALARRVAQAGTEAPRARG